MITLRTWLRKQKISCNPWHYWKGEIRNLPISSMTLFSNSGIPLDTTEKELKEMGYLLPTETLLEVLYKVENLKRYPTFVFYYEDSSFGCLPDYFTEEDEEILNF
ncbi:MAG: hypothetical protein SVO01_00015 [Thermotogota bacterium]|nr:hypothetical protein [Thermotogota bacterium]